MQQQEVYACANKEELLDMHATDMHVQVKPYRLAARLLSSYSPVQQQHVDGAATIRDLQQHSLLLG